ncbi:MAG: potassium channel protein [Burkholderiaceae bacterium]|nr:potassium channel protein [Burkholderiaceae bacterium]
MSESRLKLLVAILSLVGITIVGTVGLMYFEDWPMFDAFWLTVVSLSTTGYGDIVPQTFGGRLFLLVVLVTGLVIVTYSLGTIVNIFVEKQLSSMKGNARMSKFIDKLENHVIVCGAGRVGGNVANILKAEKTPYVVIETNESLVEQMRADGHPVLLGDATRDDILNQAGLRRAKGIICALSNDAYNVFVVLTARAVNPNLRIVSRAVQPESVVKLRHAGADKIISPNQLGGHRMAMAMLKPTAIEFIDTLFAPHRLEIQLEELLVTEKSPLANRPLDTLFDRETCDLIVVAIIREGGVKMNPPRDHIVQPGDVLVLIGSDAEMAKMAAKLGEKIHGVVS